jgi:hypothetical protein
LDHRPALSEAEGPAVVAAAVGPIWISLSLPIAAAVAIASAAGAFWPATYIKETASWSAQGVAQDLVNLFFVLPALLACVRPALRGSLRAFLLWQGLLLYLVYSYVLYAFFVHFGPLFLVYVTALGLSFYALAGSIVTADIRLIAWRLGRTRALRAMAVLLMGVGVLFTLLWLADILLALAQGTIPPSVTEVGLPVNPVHVLDLAILLPALFITAFLLLRRNPYGLALAVPLATFLVAMGIAIIAMVIVMKMRGVTVSLAMPFVLAGIVAATAGVTARFLRGCDR